MVDTESEFRDALADLLMRAAAKGVDVEGGWDVRNPDRGKPDWTVEIVELTKSLPGEDT